MPYSSQVPNVEHGVIKPRKIVALANGIIERELVLPNFFNRESMLGFAGLEGDQKTFKVPGVLPWREYEMRNDRTNPIIFDSFSEGTVNLTVTGRIYSAARITDEQFDFDGVTQADLLSKQADAVARGIEQYCVRAFNTTSYPVLVGGAEKDLFSAVLEARRVLNRLTSNTGTKRTLVVGSDFASALIQSERITKALNVGDRIAETALEEARVGRIHGFDVVESGVVAPDEAIAFTGDAFTLFTGAPSPAQEVVSASQSYNGIAMTWLRDYETERLMRRSVLVTYAGTAPAVDFLQKYNETTRQPERSTDPHFVRGLKLKLGGVSKINNAAVNTFAGLYPAGNTVGWAPPTVAVK